MMGTILLSPSQLPQQKPHLNVQHDQKQGTSWPSKLRLTMPERGSRHGSSKREGLHPFFDYSIRRSRRYHASARHPLHHLQPTIGLSYDSVRNKQAALLCISFFKRVAIMYSLAWMHPTSPVHVKKAPIFGSICTYQVHTTPAVVFSSSSAPCSSYTLRPIITFPCAAGCMYMAGKVRNQRYQRMENPHHRQFDGELQKHGRPLASACRIRNRVWGASPDRQSLSNTTPHSRASTTTTTTLYPPRLSDVHAFDEVDGMRDIAAISSIPTRSAGRKGTRAHRRIRHAFPP
jgi:hypothetical protein